MKIHNLNMEVQPRLFVLGRIVMELVASVFISWLILALVNDEPIRFYEDVYKPFLFVVTTLVCLCEGIFIFNSIISRYYPWYKAVRKRAIILFLFAIAWLYLVAHMARMLSNFFFGDLKASEPGSGHYIAITIILLFTIIYVISLIGYNYHETLKKFIVENERLQREKLELDYFALQDQLNPHFLFNNMSTLMAMIEEDNDKALKFAESFTDVYRYVLMSSRHKLVTLQDEVLFIKSYIDIHRSRLGSGLLVTFNISEKEMKRKVPVLGLQFLVENAIKHNIATKEEPLLIRISTEENMLKVSNNLQPKQSTYSTNTGLQNLKRRIQFLSVNQDLIVKRDDNIFSVKIPIFD